MTFTEKLDKMMMDRGINKSTLSKDSDIPYTTIDGFYKKGADNIKLSTLKRLSAYFKCSLDYLVDDDSEDDCIGFNENEPTIDEEISFACSRLISSNNDEKKSAILDLLNIENTDWNLIKELAIKLAK